MGDQTPKLPKGATLAGYADESAAGAPSSAPKLPAGASLVGYDGGATGEGSQLGKYTTDQGPSIWQRANTGIVSPDAVKDAMFGMNGEQLRQVRDAAPSADDNFALPNGGMPAANATTEEKKKFYESLLPAVKQREGEVESPTHAALRAGLAGAGNDAADTASSFTSPMSILTAAAGPASKLSGVPGMLAKLFLTGTGLTYGAQGAGDVYEGITDKKGITNPENAQKILGGTASVLQAAPAIHAVGRTATNVVRAAAPQAFSVGENAFIKSLAPRGKNGVRNLRNAYRVVQSDIQGSQPESIQDLHDLADQKRRQAVQDLDNRLTLQGQGINVDPTGVLQAGQDAVTNLMNAEKVYSQQNTGLTDQYGNPITRTVQEPGARAQRILSYTSNVAENLARDPRSLVTAEKMVQDINAESGRFHRMSPGEQWQALHDQPELMAKFAIKDALQSQLDRAISNYSDLKMKYGAYKEIQNHAQDRLDRMAKEQPSTQLGRRTLEAIGSGAGAMLGLHGAGGIGLGVGGYKLGQALGDLGLEHMSQPDYILNRAYKQPLQPVQFPHSAAPAITGGANAQMDNDAANTNATSVPPMLQNAVTSKAPAASQPQQRTATRSQVSEFAKQKGLPPAEVEKQLRAAGYQIQ